MTLFALSACASTTDHDPYHERTQAAQDAATSDFENRVLSDGEIDRVEYEEAMNRFAECMASLGVEVTYENQSGYFISEVADLARYDEFVDGCRVGTNFLIEPLYVDILVNPENLEPEDAIAECLVRHGVAPSSFEGEDFRQLSEGPGGLIEIPESSEWSDLDLNPGTNPRVDACLANANT